DQYEAKAAVRGRPRPQGRRSLDAAVGDEDHTRDPVRATVHAGARSACQDADHPYPSCARHRRVWRRPRRGIGRGYGRAERGGVAIEDIGEQIVGEIADEHDEDTLPGVVRQSDGSFLADARASLEDVTSIVGAEFDVGEVAQEVDTLAGYVATRIGRVPVRGELV